MPNNRRDRSRKQARREPFRESKPRILVVTEGAVTEPEYLRGFINACKNPRVEIKIAGEHGRDPKSLVGIAKQHRDDADRAADRENDDNLRFESVWCVFDVDDHLKIPDAKQMARDNGIELAISNPAIELWLLLHFRESPGMQHRDKVRAMLAEFVPGYDKHVAFAEYFPGYDAAVRRAQQLDRAATQDGEEGRNPSTGVYRLTALIRDD